MPQNLKIQIASGNDERFANLKNGPFIQFGDLPIKNGDFPQLCKRLPEGISSWQNDVSPEKMLVGGLEPWIFMTFHMLLIGTSNPN